MRAKAMRIVVLAELAAGRGLGQQRDRLAFPEAPRRGPPRPAPSRSEPDQPLAVGGHHVAALGLGDRRQEALPLVGEHLDDAELIVPVELAPWSACRCRARQARSSRSDASPHRPAPASSPRSRRTPATCRSRASRAGARCRRPDARSCSPRGWRVASTLRSRAGRTGSRRRASDRTAGDAFGEMVPPGPPCRKTGRLGALRADALPIDRVAVADIQHAAVERLDLG